MFNQLITLLIVTFFSLPNEKKVVRTDVIDIHFKFGSDKLTADNIIEMDSLINRINRYNGAELIYTLKSQTCVDELKKYPNIGILRSKRVADYMQPRILDQKRKLLIDPKTIVENSNCQSSAFSNLTRVALYAVKR